MDYQTLETKRQQLQHLLTIPTSQLTDRQEQELQTLLKELANLYQIKPQELKDILTPPQPHSKSNHIDTALLTSLVSEYQTDRQRLSSLLNQTSLEQNQQDLVGFLLKRHQLNLIQTQINQNLDKQQSTTIKQASTTKPDSDPHRTNLPLASQVINQKIKNTSLQLSPSQKKSAVQQLSNDLSLLQPNYRQLSYLAELAITQQLPNTQESSPLHQLDQTLSSLSHRLTPNDQKQLLKNPQEFIDTNFTDSTLSTITNAAQLRNILSRSTTQETLSQLDLDKLTRQIVTDLYQPTPQDSPTTDQLKSNQQQNKIAQNLLALNSSTQNILRQLQPLSSLDQLNLLASLRQQNPNLRLHPILTAESWASFVQNLPDQHRFTPSLIRFLGRGITPEQLHQTINQAYSQPSHPLHQQVTNNLKQYTTLLAQYQKLFDFPTGRKILQQAGKKSSLAFLTKFKNKFISIFPAASHLKLEAVLSPIKYFRRRAAAHVSKRLFTFLAQKTSHQVIKKGLTLLAEKGVKTGFKQLLKGLALKTAKSASLHLAVETLNVIPGLGVILDIAITVIIAVFKKVKQLAHNLAISIYGEKIKKRDLLAPLALGASAVIGAFVGLGRAFNAALTATFSAGASALMTLFLASFATLLFYIAAFNAGPLISTIAHLQSGLPALDPFQSSPLGGLAGSGSGGSGSAGYTGNIAPYTGPIIEGCAPAWPTVGGWVSQGPHGAFSHSVVEALDIAVVVGTPIYSVAPGTVQTTGWGGTYGNWVIINHSSQGASYQAIYGHLSAFGVNPGDSVQAGTPIGLSGATSSVPGFQNPHLHLEYRGVKYNQCGAAGITVPDRCNGTTGPTGCTINGQLIYGPQ